MSETRFDEKLRSHYAGRAMTEERLSLLAALAPSSPASSAPASAASEPARALRRGVFAGGGGLSRAAAVFLFFVAGAVAMQWLTERRVAAELSDRLAEMEKQSVTLAGELGDARTQCARLEEKLSGDNTYAARDPDADSPRYVAVRIASSGCPGCGKTRELFDKLQQQHVTDEVMFVSFDVSSSGGRKQAEHLACNLGLKWAAGDCGKCCAIRLFDRRQKQLVATQFALSSTDEFERMLDEALKKPGG